MLDCGALRGVYVLFLFLLIVAAVVILLVFFFSTRRKNLCEECCGGRPGLFSPVDLLHRGPHRLIYAAVFGVMSDQFLTLVLIGVGSFCTSGNPYGKAFCDVVLSKPLGVLFLCVVYGPVFACINAPIRPLLGHITGLIYLIFLIITFQVQTAVTYECGGVEYDGAEVHIAISVLSSLPSYVFYVILLVWFVYEIVNDVMIQKTGSGILFTHKKNSYLFRYTTHLLNKKEPCKEGRWQQIKSFFWVYDKDFRFPLTFLAPLVVMISIAFKLFFLVINVAYYTGSRVQIFDSYRDEIDHELYDTLIAAVKGTIAIGTIAGFIAGIVSVVLLIQMVATVHKHLKLAAQGKFKFYSKTLPSHTNILVSSLKYGGYQIGYFVWAYIIIWILVLVVGLLVEALALGLILFPQFVGPIAFSIFLSLVWLPLVLIILKVMCKFVFLESDSRGKFLAITNRNCYNLFSYFVFLYNAIVGFVGAIIRVLISLLVGTLLLFRLDQNIMMDNFHFADFGNKVYRGFLYLEHTYNNPVANAFVAMLIDGSGHQKEKGALHFKDPVKKNRRIRNKWLVAYTLIHNPSIRPLRASQLHAQHRHDDVEAGKACVYEEMHYSNPYEVTVQLPGTN